MILTDLKQKWAWALAPYYSQALKDGSVDAFFGEVFCRWFERFPLKSGDCPEHPNCRADFLEAEKKVLVIFFGASHH